jgi:hypothetical protein
MAERRKVGVTAYVNGVLWAGLYTRVTFPTCVGLDIVGASVGLIDVHDVGWADIYAMSASIASGHVNKSGHYIFSLYLDDFKG